MVKRRDPYDTFWIEISIIVLVGILVAATATGIAFLFEHRPTIATPLLIFGLSGIGTFLFGKLMLR